MQQVGENSETKKMKFESIQGLSKGLIKQSRVRKFLRLSRKLKTWCSTNLYTILIVMFVVLLLTVIRRSFKKTAMVVLPEDSAAAVQIRSGHSNLCDLSIYCQKYHQWTVAPHPNYTFCYSRLQIELQGGVDCSESKRLRTAVFVISSPSNGELREKIRTLWDTLPNNNQLDGKEKQSSSENGLFFVTYLSAFSTPESSAEELQKLELEQKKQKDLIIVKLKGYEFSNAMLTMALYEHVSNCETLKNAEFFFRVGDGAFSELHLVLKFANSVVDLPQPIQHYIMGLVVENEIVERKIAETRYLPEGAFASATFKTYISNFAYLMPTKTLIKLYNEALCVRLLYFDDVILNGLLAETIGVKLINRSEFSLLLGKDA